VSELKQLTTSQIASLIAQGKRDYNVLVGSKALPDYCNGEVSPPLESAADFISERIHEAIPDHAQEIATLRAEVERLELRNSALDGSVRHHNSRAETAEAIVQIQADKIHKVEADANRLQDACSGLVRTNTSLSTRLQTAEAEVLRLRKVLELLKSGSTNYLDIKVIDHALTNIHTEEQAIADNHEVARLRKALQTIVNSGSSDPQSFNIAENALANGTGQGEQ